MYQNFCFLQIQMSQMSSYSYPIVAQILDRDIIVLCSFLYTLELPTTHIKFKLTWGSNNDYKRKHQNLINTIYYSKHSTISLQTLILPHILFSEALKTAFSDFLLVLAHL